MQTTPPIAPRPSLAGQHPPSSPGLHLAHSTKPVVPRDRLLRLPEVVAVTGLGKSTIYDLMRAGRFPKNIVLSRRCAAWPESSVLSWIQAQIAKSTT